jgi:hypothetical protein
VPDLRTDPDYESDTDMSADLIPIEAPMGRDLTPGQFELMKALGAVLHLARYVPWISNGERGAYAAAKAYELGFPATSAPDVFHDINGKLGMAAQAAWAKVLRSGLLAKIEVDEGDDYCAIYLTRKDNGIRQGYRFSLDAARRAGLVKPDGNYEKWLPNMLYWRAMGFAIDRTFPDVTMGLKDSVQFGAEPPAGRVDIVSGDYVEGVISEEG